MALLPVAGCVGEVTPDCNPPPSIAPELFRNAPLAPELDGFDSPYLGHNGSWDGAGGGMGGSSKRETLDKEVEMGLRWTFMPVYWSALEKDGPTTPDNDPHGTWASLDRFVKQARDRGLHILMQAPIVGGNAGGAPSWAGERRAGSSAPRDMDALVEFARKLVERYRPGGTLAQAEGWQDGYGVRAWELENEPDAYLKNWKETADDYAEFVVRAAQRMKQEDPGAIIITPSITGGEGGVEFLKAALDKGTQAASDAYKQHGQQFAIGPATDVVSFHNYEAIDRRAIECVFGGVQRTFESFSSQEGFEYARKVHYWHTEGGLDFMAPGPGLSENRARWMVQWFARAFSLGISKVTVMDATDHPPQMAAVKTMVRLLPDPFPMVEITANASRARLFRSGPMESAVFIAWAANGSSGKTSVDVEVHSPSPRLVQLDGSERTLEPRDGTVRVELTGAMPYSEPVFIVDR